MAKAIQKPEAPKRAAGNHKVFLEKEHKNDDACYISVNGRTILVQKGKTIGLNAAYAEAVANAKAAKIEAQRYIDSVSKNG